MLFGWEGNIPAASFPTLSWGETPSLADLVEVYALPEERLAVKMGLRTGDFGALAIECQAARRLASRLRRGPLEGRPRRLAEALGILVAEERWGIVAGRFFQWGECTGRARRLVLNQWAVEEATAGMIRWGRPREIARRVAERLPDLILAHELHHCLLADAEESPASPLARELAAHSFARALCESPYSPLLYDQLVLQATGKSAKLGWQW